MIDLDELRKIVEASTAPLGEAEAGAAADRKLLLLGRKVLLPMAEALEKLTMLDMEGGEEMLHAVGGGMAVLAQLEEALK